MLKTVAATIGLAALACSACTNVLGLDDMTFDRGEPLAANSASGGSGGSGSILGPEITPEDPTPPPEVYPTVWQPGQKLVTSPVTGDATEFLVYDEEHGSLLAYRAHPTLVEVTRTWEWVAGFSHVLQIPNGTESSRLLGYDSESGLVRYLEELPGPGPIQGEELAGTPGWSHLVPIEREGEWYLLSYSRESGHFRIGLADPDAAPSTVTLGTWDHPWTHLVPLAVPPGSAHTGSFLKYDQVSGDAELVRLSGSEEGLETVAQGTLEANWSNLASFRFGSGIRLVSYASSNGRVVTAELELVSPPNPAILSVRTLEQGVWREGISDLLSLQIASVPYAVTHSAATGVADMLGIKPIEQTSVTPVK